MLRRFEEKIDILLSAELGAVRKTHGAEVEIALAYPNTYHLGMSNLGIHQVYSILNRRADSVCERVFLPSEEDREEFFKTGMNLSTLESKRQLKDFDILAFSVSFEQDYPNIIEMLNLSGIPLDKKTRTVDDPLVIFGGACSFFNPEPLTDFFDVVIVGEGEEVLEEFIDSYKENRGKGRLALLRSLCRIPGVYVPEFYEVAYDEDGMIKERIIVDSFAPKRIIKRIVKNIDAAPAATAILTPHTEFSNMYLAEITRGCGRHCRFCMAGYIYLPPRHLDIDHAREQAIKGENLCKKIGLVGSALSDYPSINDFCSSLRGDISVSSLRADSVSKLLIQCLAKSGHKTISIAPEAGSERLRKVINKGITENDILQAAGQSFSAGIPNLKLYFMIGLPTERQEDLIAIIDLAEKIHNVQLKHARPSGKIGRITLSVNSFVPKPFTPFQWQPMEDIIILNKKLRVLAKAVKKIGNMHMIHDLPKWEYIQALLSRGDRRVGKLLRAAHAQQGDWKKAAKGLGMNIPFYVYRQRTFDEILPWDFIDIGVRKEYLKEEYSRALDEKYTPPCSVGSCKSCGVCS
ncbi:MAG TPA: TIGR03960 family B12-binding radical SAM protein [Nitrospirota bacterium]|nr:TIGR03960 family B12-binding radical SAM protein [Nitrospirota bacterium]